MSQLNPQKLHTRFLRGVSLKEFRVPRRYTLTHSDITGVLFLSVGSDYDKRAISGLYVRLMRDEVVAEWLQGEAGMSLHVYCHVSGGLAFGTAAWRYAILQFHMPQVLQAFRYGDRVIYANRPELEQTPVWVHFRSSQTRYHRKEDWGTMGKYKI